MKSQSRLHYFEFEVGMSRGFVAALVFFAALYFPMHYALRVTIDAFRTSPMVRIVSVQRRGAALWIIAASTVYVLVVGNVLLSKLPAELAAALTPWFSILFGIGPFMWWFVSRQAHAQFDENTFVPANTFGWAIRRAIRQYLKDLPYERSLTVTVGGNEGRVLSVAWTWPHQEERSAQFILDTRGKAVRLLARIYALSPDDDQFDVVTFRRAKRYTKPRGQLSLRG